MDKEFACCDGAKLHYQVDDFTNPWQTPQTVPFGHTVTCGRG